MLSEDKCKRLKDIVLEDLERYRVYLENLDVGMPRLGNVSYFPSVKIYEIPLLYQVMDKELAVGSYMLDLDERIVFPREDNGLEKDIAAKVKHWIGRKYCENMLKKLVGMG